MRDGGEDDDTDGFCEPNCSEFEVRSDGGHQCVDCGAVYWYDFMTGLSGPFTLSEWKRKLDDEFKREENGGVRDREDLQRMNCNRCEKIVMPGEGIRVRNYMVDMGVETVAYCDAECLHEVALSSGRKRSTQCVRSAEEIDEKYEEFEEVIYDDESTGEQMLLAAHALNVLDWVRGVRDDL